MKCCYPVPQSVIVVAGPGAGVPSLLAPQDWHEQGAGEPEAELIRECRQSSVGLEHLEYQAECLLMRFIF